LYISYPILSAQAEIGGGEERERRSTDGPKPANFKGEVVTAIEVNTLGNLLKSELFTQFNITIALLDNSGVIIYTNNQSLIGKDIFGEEFRSTLGFTLPKGANLLIEVVKMSPPAN
jgi:hypothetical protein